MTTELSPHPTTPCNAIERIEVEASRLQNRLMVFFTLFGDLSAIKGLDTPEGVEPGERCDELWRSTCFECFVSRNDSHSYLEANFTARRDWAAYQFSKYRDGMITADIEPPQIRSAIHANSFSLSAAFDLPDGFDLADELVCGITAVIETQSGDVSYWALEHPRKKPDFHDKTAFKHIIIPWKLS